MKNLDKVMGLIIKKNRMMKNTPKNIKWDIVNKIDQDIRENW